MKRLLILVLVGMLSATLSACVVVPARGYYAPPPPYYYR